MASAHRATTSSHSRRYLEVPAAVRVPGGAARARRALRRLARVVAARSREARDDLRTAPVAIAAPRSPRGSTSARDHVTRLVDRSKARFRSPTRASCSAASRRARCCRSTSRSIAMRRRPALVLMSGTLLAEPCGRRGCASSPACRSCMSHGRARSAAAVRGRRDAARSTAPRRARNVELASSSSAVTRFRPVVLASSRRPARSTLELLPIRLQTRVAGAADVDAFAPPTARCGSTPCCPATGSSTPRRSTSRRWPTRRT